jgi:hypothetical protein
MESRINTNTASKTLEKYDIVFSNVHLKSLVQESKFELAESYVNTFFFKYGVNCFHFDGAESSFKLYKLNEIADLIGRDIKKTYYVEDKKRDYRIHEYLKSASFMDQNYRPTINYRRSRVFIESKIIAGLAINQQYVNMKRPFAFDDFTEKHKTRDKKFTAKLQLIYDHVKKVLCGNNDEQYEFTLNFVACTFGGRKVRKALYWQSTERTGKGMFIEGVLKRILGDSMFKTSSVECVTTYTKDMEGRLLINIDEMPVDTNDFKNVTDKMKSLITERTFTCREMRCQPYEQTNSFNIIVSTNNDSIQLTQTNKTKYVCNDIDESYVGNHAYFEKLTAAVQDIEVIKAFYNDMMVRFATLGDWNEDKAMPVTNTMKTKIIESLPYIVKHLKDAYVLKNCDMNITTNEFFSKYADETKDRSSKQKLGRYLKKLGIEPIKVNNKTGMYYVYRICHEELKKNFEKQGWIDETVDFASDAKVDLRIEDSDGDGYENGVEVTDRKKMKIHLLELEVEKLKQQQKPEECRRKIANVTRSYEDDMNDIAEMEKVFRVMPEKKPVKLTKQAKEVTSKGYTLSKKEISNSFTHAFD